MARTDDKRRQHSLGRYDKEYAKLKAELEDLGYVLQGSLTERWMECGKPRCLCHKDPEARHGPYHQWSWKRDGRTRSVYLKPAQAALSKEWIRNNRRLERVIRRMRSLSLRVARLHEIDQK